MMWVLIRLRNITSHHMINYTVGVLCTYEILQVCSVKLTSIDSQKRKETKFETRFNKTYCIKGLSYRTSYDMLFTTLIMLSGELEARGFVYLPVIYQRLGCNGKCVSQYSN
jgi:hypothetical protein